VHSKYKAENPANQEEASGEHVNCELKKKRQQVMPINIPNTAIMPHYRKSSVMQDSACLISLATTGKYWRNINSNCLCQGKPQKKNMSSARKKRMGHDRRN
jgi:hypothetical protein